MFGTFEAVGSSSSKCHTKTHQGMSKMLEHILLQTEANVKLLNITGIRKAQVKNRGFQLISVKNGDTNTELVLRAGPAGSNQLWLAT